MKYTVLDNTELYISRLNLDNTKSYYSPPCARAPPRSIWTGSHHIFSTTNWISPHIFEKDPKNKRVRFTCKVEEHQRINGKYGALKYPLPLQLWSSSHFAESPIGGRTRRIIQRTGRRQRRLTLEREGEGWNEQGRQETCQGRRSLGVAAASAPSPSKAAVSALGGDCRHARPLPGLLLPREEREGGAWERLGSRDINNGDESYPTQTVDSVRCPRAQNTAE
jgi:hypothetical protein